MKLETHLPAIALRRYIKSYMVIDCQEEVVNKVLPGTSPALAFRFRGQTNYINGTMKHSLPVSVMSGLRKSVRLINYHKNSSTIIILFQEGGAAAFFTEPLHELFEESVSLDSLLTARQTARIEEILAEAKSNQQRARLLDDFLLSRLSSPKTDDLIISAIHHLQAAKGVLKIKAFAGHFNLSHDAFEKRFRKIVGTSPKQFANIVRMRSIILQKQPAQSFTDMAYDGGYFDQPHFIRDFKVFTGQTPTDFFKSPSYW